MREIDRILQFMVKSEIRFNAGVRNTPDMGQVVCVNVLRAHQFGTHTLLKSAGFTKFTVGVM